jgi:hypothetical protein
MGEWIYGTHFLDLGTSWRWVVSLMPWPLYPRYPLYRMLVGPQRRSGRRGEEKILDYRDSNSDPTVVRPVASRYADCAVPGPVRALIGVLHCDRAELVWFICEEPVWFSFKLVIAWVLMLMGQSCLIDWSRETDLRACRMFREAGRFPVYYYSLYSGVW